MIDEDGIVIKTAEQIENETKSGSRKRWGIYNQ